MTNQPITFKLTEPVAIAMGKAFAVYCVEFDRQRGVTQDLANYDCVAVEESDFYQSFMSELYPDINNKSLSYEQVWGPIDADPMYKLFRKALYAEAMFLSSIQKGFSPEQAQSIIERAWPPESTITDQEEIETFIWGKDDPQDYFSKFADTAELIADFEEYLKGYERG